MPVNYDDSDVVRYDDALEDYVFNSSFKPVDLDLFWDTLDAGSMFKYASKAIFQRLQLMQAYNFTESKDATLYVHRDDLLNWPIAVPDIANMILVKIDDDSSVVSDSNFSDTQWRAIEDYIHTLINIFAPGNNRDMFNYNSDSSEFVLNYASGAIPIYNLVWHAGEAGMAFDFTD